MSCRRITKRDFNMIKAAEAYLAARYFFSLEHKYSEWYGFL
jgi:hypothetical protein